MATSRDTLRLHMSVLAFAAALVAGCQGQDDARRSWAINDQFRPDNEPRAFDAYYQQQTANGARADGTLHAAHFTGGELNSLGHQKLAAMLHGDEAGKLAIYLDVPRDSAYASRESSVVGFLSDRGLASDAFEITAGVNPNGGTPAVAGLNGLGKHSVASTSSETSASPMSK